MRLRLDVDFEEDEVSDMSEGIKKLVVACLDKLNEDVNKDEPAVTMIIPVGIIQIARKSRERISEDDMRGF